MNFTSEGSLAIARRDFLMLLGDKNVRACLYMGNVIEPGKPSNDWICYHGKHRVIVRGTNNVSYHKCIKKCGRNTYFATGKFYLYPKPMEYAAILYEDRRLIVRSDIFEPIEAQIRALGKRNIAITKIPVLDKPLDGIEEELVP